MIEARPNVRWSVDFVHDQFSNGPRFPIHNVVGDVTKECLAAIADPSISDRRHRRPTRQSRPVDFPITAPITSNAMLAWAQHRWIAWRFIAPSRPKQNEIFDAFNGRSATNFSTRRS